MNMKQIDKAQKGAQKAYDKYLAACRKLNDVVEREREKVRQRREKIEKTERARIERAAQAAAKKKAAMDKELEALSFSDAAARDAERVALGLAPKFIRQPGELQAVAS